MPRDRRQYPAGAVSRYVLLLLCAAFCQARDSQAATRPFRVDDLLAQEHFPEFTPRIAFSPDGESLAYVRIRPQATWGNLRWTHATFFAGGDVWIHAASGKPPFNLTQGAADQSSWWAPAWSPDGGNLAMVSTRGNNVTLWIWDKTSKAPRQLAPQGLADGGFGSSAFMWWDARHILCGLRTDGTRAEDGIALRAMRVATHGWAAFDRGEVSASELTSGRAPAKLDGIGGALTLIDIETGESRALSQRTWASNVLISPDGSAVAYWSYAAPVTPRADAAVDPGKAYYDLKVVDASGHELLTFPSAGRLVRAQTLRWSSDGQEIAFWAQEKTGNVSVYRGRPQTGEVHRQSFVEPGARMRPGPLEWAAGRRLLVYAERRDRNDWYAIDQHGSARCLTSTLPTVPPNLIAAPGRRAFVALAGTALWKIDAVGATAIDLSESLNFPVKGITLSKATARDGGFTHIALSAPSDGAASPRFVALDLASGTRTSFQAPRAEATLIGYSARGSQLSTVFHTIAADRAVLERVSDKGRSDSLMDANGFLATVSPGTFRPLQHVGPAGQALTSWLILPPDYRSGRHYPLVTVPYPGETYSATPPTLHQVSSPNFLNMQIAAGQGYVVLLPSMPLDAAGTPVNIIQASLLAVNAAVDKAIELGFADADRLLLMGHSFGGFAVNGIITKSKRFKAAVSISGVSDTLSKYGQTMRYDVFNSSTDFAYYESGQGGLGGPPWKDPEIYLNTSAVTQADRIETPLLLMHGDLDETVSIGQSEELFQALYRQGKPAAFVRYWGEGHLLQSPANVRDLWSRATSWFDEHADIGRDASGYLLWDHDKVGSGHGLHE